MGDWKSYDGVADTYDRVRAPIHAHPARDLVELLKLGSGDRVVDVGTGTGVAAEAAREAVGPSGLVVGIDPSLEMLRRARQRDAASLLAAQAIDLPFRDATFDAVIAIFVIAFFTRYETAFFDLLRVLRTGGRLGVSAWTGAPDEFSRTWRQVAESFVGKDLLADAVRKVAPWEERFSDPRRLQETLRDAGLRGIEVHRREYRFTVSQADYLAGREVSAQGRFLRDMLGDAAWERFSDRVAEEFRSRFPDPMGDTNDVLLAVGKKP